MAYDRLLAVCSKIAEWFFIFCAEGLPCSFSKL